MINLTKGLIEFQHSCPAIEKEKTVEVRTKSGHTYNFKYASFGNIVQTIKEPLYMAKLGYTFFTTDNKFVCRLVHESGEFQDTEIELPRYRDNIQENGSMLSYLKRYTLVLALGIDTDSDDDGNIADKNEVKEKKLFNNEYKIPFGTFKGKTFKEVDPTKLQQYVTWMMSESEKKGTKLEGAQGEFIRLADNFLSDLAISQV